MKIILPIVLLGILSAFTCTAQSIERSLISTAGGCFEAGKLSLSYTVGDLLTETFATEKLYLTQGFLQPEILATGNPMQKSNRSALQVYPNPASDIFIVEFIAQQEPVYNTKYQLCIIDIWGKVVQREQLQQEQSSINIQNLTPGTYLIQVLHTQTAFKSTLILQKK